MAALMDRKDRKFATEQTLLSGSLGSRSVLGTVMLLWTAACEYPAITEPRVRADVLDVADASEDIVRPDVQGSDVEAGVDVGVDVAIDADVPTDIGTDVPCTLRCDAGCVDPFSDPNNCGACGNRCAGASNARGVCRAGRCEVECLEGFYSCSGVCGPGCPGLAAPRQIAPLSAEIVSSQRPNLRWTSSMPGGYVEICRDRACEMVVARQESVRDNVRVATPLAPGVYFWRVRGYLSSGDIGQAVSPVWSFLVGHRDTTRTTSRPGFIDVNNDGFADAIVASVEANAGRGRVHVYLGSSSGFGAIPSQTLVGPDIAETQFGITIIGAGDLNGDGFGDVVIRPNGVGTYVYFGGATGLATAPSGSIDPPSSAPLVSWFRGQRIGDFNGDGFADIGLTAFMNHPLRVLAGNSRGAPAIHTTVGVDATTGYFASNLTSTGDCNGDGYADFVTNGRLTTTDPYRLQLHRGTLGSGPATRGTGFEFSGTDAMGRAVGGLMWSGGDINADGLGDLVTYLSNASGGVVRVYLGQGAGNGLSDPPASVIEPTTASARTFGTRVAAADFNGDGFDDLLIVDGPTGSSTDRGLLRFYRGSSGGPEVTHSAVIMSPVGADPTFGAAFSSCGDVDRDGYVDLIVGSTGAFGGEGAVYLYRGGPSFPEPPVATIRSPDGAGGGFGAPTTPF